MIGVYTKSVTYVDETEWAPISIYVGCRGTEERPEVVGDPYTLDGAYWSDTSGDDGSINYASFAVYGVIVNHTNSVSKILLTGNYMKKYEKYNYSIEADVNFSNIDFRITSAPVGTFSVVSVTFTAYDPNDNVIQTATLSKK